MENYRPQKTFWKMFEELCKKSDETAGERNGEPVRAYGLVRIYEWRDTDTCRALTEEERTAFGQHLDALRERYAETEREYRPKHCGYEISICEDGSIKLKDISVARVRIREARNRPKAEITFHKNVESVRLICGSGPAVTYRRYIGPIKVPLASVSDLMDITDSECSGRFGSTKISGAGLLFTKDSVKEFYGFCTETGECFFVRFTDAMREKYWRYAYGTSLRRYSTNTGSDQNDWGLCFPVWEDNLIQPCNGHAYVSEDIRLDEIRKITKGYEDSWIAQDAIRRYRAVHQSEEEAEKDIVEAEKAVSGMQKLVEDNRSAILIGAARTLGADPADEVEAEWFLRENEQSYGFDCGRVSFFFKDDGKAEVIKRAAERGLTKRTVHLRRDGRFTLSFPITVQSTTVQSAMASEIKKLAEEAGSPLYSWTELD